MGLSRCLASSALSLGMSEAQRTPREPLTVIPRQCAFFSPPFRVLSLCYTQGPRHLVVLRGGIEKSVSTLIFLEVEVPFSLLP